MENMDKELTVPKWVLIAQMPQKISAQNVCPSQKFEIFEKGSLWVLYSVVISIEKTTFSLKTITNKKIQNS